ncbi:hypothetical protein KBC75_03010 [Candidatus Shapirobacteria bacterium]|nr:hypothetical protein [Candidatus Shapirobacteria bacterium]
MDITQIVIVICLLAVTGVLFYCGIYTVQLLKELKNALAKTTAILDDTHLITSSVARPVSSFSEFLMGFKNGLTIFNKFFDSKSNKSD